MSNTNLSGIQLAAALAEEIYRRNSDVAQYERDAAHADALVGRLGFGR
jgi:hypothetical protein